MYVKKLNNKIVVSLQPISCFYHFCSLCVFQWGSFYFWTANGNENLTNLTSTSTLKARSCWKACKTKCCTFRTQASFYFIQYMQNTLNWNAHKLIIYIKTFMKSVSFCKQCWRSIIFKTCITNLGAHHKCWGTSQGGKGDFKWHFSITDDTDSHNPSLPYMDLHSDDVSPLSLLLEREKVNHISRV